VELFPADVAATAKPFASDAGVPALEIAAALPPGYPRVRAHLWIFTDEMGVVVGYGHAQSLDSDPGIAGFVRADRPVAVVRAYPWPEQGGMVPGLALRLQPQPPR
jgi:hypothetical protein